MSPEMYTILGVGIGLLAVIVALFAAAWQMMNSRFDAASSDTNARFDDASSNTNAGFNALSSDMNARFEESNQRYLLMAEQNRQLIAGVSQMSQRVARLEGLLRLPHETDGHGEG
jgi:hypothetical protein